MILSHRIQLDPTFKQRSYFSRACGTARMVWNHALAEWNRQHKAGGKPSGIKLKKEFNAIKYQSYPWLKSIHRDAHSQPFSALQTAFTRFFHKKSKRPKFKSRGKCRDSFYAANDQFRFEGQRVRLPLVGCIRMRESLRFNGKIIGATVSRTADRWFIAIQVEITDHKPVSKPESTVGVDLGVKTLATLSTGELVENKRPLQGFMKRLVRCSRRLSRSRKGSRRSEKTKRRLQRIHDNIANIRKDITHKLTTQLCKEYTCVVIEDLSVKEMLGNRRLSRSISDVSFGEIRRQIHYKSKLHSCDLVVVDRWFPSSKTCSSCGNVKQDLKLSDRTYLCDSCGLVLDRDFNAALNLRAAGLAEHARGPEGSGCSHKAITKPCRVESRTKPCQHLGTI